jgi:uncharacterized protein (TIGR02246 family)
MTTHLSTVRFRTEFPSIALGLIALFAGNVGIASGDKNVDPNQVAERYFASVRARDIEAFMALFAPDATFILPDGRIVTGQADIRKMESAVFENGAPFPTPNTIVVSKDTVAVQIDVRVPSGAVLKMANFYHLNDEGLIKTLSVYRQATLAQ